MHRAVETRIDKERPHAQRSDLVVDAAAVVRALVTLAQRIIGSL
jgi:hypothetical protein